MTPHEVLELAAVSTITVPLSSELIEPLLSLVLLTDTVIPLSNVYVSDKAVNNIGEFIFCITL